VKGEAENLRMVTTGPTNTNLLDLYLLLVEPAGR